MPVNPLEPKILNEVDSLILHAGEALEVVPARLRDSVQDIIDTLGEYKESDEAEWPQYRVSVPWDYVKREFSARINLWRDNKIISFQNDDAPKSSMAHRAMSTLADGGFSSYVMSGDVGIHVEVDGRNAIHYLDNHFLAHPYSAIVGGDDSVVFTILDSRYYRVEDYETTDSGTLVLSTHDLQQRIQEFASENEAYARHIGNFVGE